jgi:hypothetical protein
MIRVLWTLPLTRLVGVVANIRKCTPKWLPRHTKMYPYMGTKGSVCCVLIISLNVIIVTFNTL